MLERLKNNVRLLRRSKRHVILFELTYKLLAVAVIYPILTAAINLCMKVAGIRYLTNEYIDLTHYSYHTIQHYSSFSTLFNNAEEDLVNLFIKKYNFEALFLIQLFFLHL